MPRKDPWKYLVQQRKHMQELQRERPGLYNRAERDCLPWLSETGSSDRLVIETFKRFGLNWKVPHHWVLLVRILVNSLHSAAGHRQKIWTPHRLAQLGRDLSKMPAGTTNEEAAEKLRPYYNWIDKESLRKRFPAARRAYAAANGNRTKLSTAR
jgi:hypothetical protein